MFNDYWIRINKYKKCDFVIASACLSNGILKGLSRNKEDPTKQRGTNLYYMYLSTFSSGF